MPWDGPIALAATAFGSYAWVHYFWGGAADAFGWPMKLAAAAANRIAWAQLFLGRCFRCPGMGPMH